MATAAHPGHEIAPSPFTPGRVVAVVAGSLAALVGIALAIAGVVLLMAHLTLRDADGFLMSSTERFTTPTRALTSEGLTIGHVDGPGAARAAEAAPIRVRVRVTSADGRAIFVGIARERAVGRYLRGIAHDEIADVHRTPFTVTTLRRTGAAVPAPPARQRLWAAGAAGRGTQTAEWRVRSGRWAVVVMNADGRRGIAADVTVGARAPWLPWVGLGLMAFGGLALAGGAALTRGGLRGGPVAAAGAPTSAATATAAEAEAPAQYPVAVDARLDEPLSRWLWLVKWLLAVPHAIALAFLWIAVAVLWVAALVAIVATGCYPRAIFDFNLGVLRWTWRVSYYATNAIGTDRYPPFTLGPADYPAELDVPYPERLSRGRALVKWWLLALPQYVVVVIFLGGWNTAVTAATPGLLPVLVLIAGGALLFTGRYPRDLFDVVVGINRWALRVAAYALLMRDEYPPFRLGP
jgi:hypothetical protein